MHESLVLVTLEVIFSSCLTLDGEEWKGYELVGEGRQSGSGGHFTETTLKILFEPAAIFKDANHKFSDTMHSKYR